ncbi:MAG: DUF2254 domain-containing protein [Acidimicrobiales bacterium]|nr:DUF2254 domain-containing protein [Acidimicrobiales bacterium]
MPRQSIPVAERRNARVAKIREALRESLWFTPMLFVVAAIIGAIITTNLEYEVARDRDFSAFFAVNADDARAIVSTIATSMLTFMGVVFSITLVALQVASGQYSPRVVRGFVRNRTTKITLGTFMATFVFSLLVLGTFQTSNADRTVFVPILSVALAQLLVLATLFVFIAFVHSIVRAMRVTYVIDGIAEETRKAIEENQVPRSEIVEIDPAHYTQPTHVIALEGPPGVLDGVEADRMVALARSYDCVLRVLPKVGDYLATGVSIIEVFGNDAPRWSEIRSCLVLGAERTLYQDIAYGFRQLVDIAIRALSPAVNDPTTAAQVIDRLTDLLIRLARQNRRQNAIVDRDGSVRLLFSIPSWSDLLDLAFDEIRVYGADSPQIPRRLLAALDDIEAVIADAPQEPLNRHRDAVFAAAKRHSSGTLAGLALTPNRRGIG